MPIGKNAIKRVTNNSATATKTQEAEPVLVTEKLTPPTAAPKTKPKATKKVVEKKTAPKKSMEKEPDFSPVKTAEKVTKKNTKSEARQGEGYVNLGGELPYYLL